MTNKNGYYVYILASKKNGTLYIGVTNNLVKRVYEHKNNIIEGFTKKYNVHKLVYYEEFNDIYEAITREKRLKKWRRKWKIELIEKSNSMWKDLYYDIIGIGFPLETVPLDSRFRGNDRKGAGMTERARE